ncbi:hypothetical protein QNI16_27085 [Cytophagaceae bacterium YF14B1]|uniref:Nucleotidyltransferase n=1 Tax=Xanthocytophaga flava TaxID=3048013 RepID=A0AAE3QXA9_9BACT|nr:hypothetical protein [Xanthocytophaga flavus]MDJ1484193.1 hypothetical protein [Xanthocytophaga flavus]
MKRIDDVFDKFAKDILVRDSPLMIQSLNALDNLLLNKKNFSSSFTFESGSSMKGTAVKGYSDLDLFAVIKKEQACCPAKCLNQLKYIISAQYPNTIIELEVPAVVLQFKTRKKVEVVPCFINGEISTNTGKYMAYYIPDGLCKWKFSNPIMYYFYLNQRDKELFGRLKRLIRLIKVWKYNHRIPLSSFYLEVFVTDYASKLPKIIYSLDLKYLFEKLACSELLPIHNLLGIDVNINPFTDKRVTNVFTKEERTIIKACKSYAKDALDFEDRKKETDTVREWRKVFNNKGFTIK